MKKVIKINESELNCIISEAMNEIGFDTINRASDAAGMYRPDINYKEWDVFDAINEIREALDYYTSYGRHRKPINGIENNPQYKAACDGLEAIEAFFTKKGKQQNNFYDRSEDMSSEYNKEFEAKALEMFPELADNSSNGYYKNRPNPSKMTDEMYDQIVSQLSPDAKAYIENYGW